MISTNIIAMGVPNGAKYWMHGEALDKVLSAIPPDKLKSSLEDKGYIMMLTLIFTSEDDMFEEHITSIKDLLDRKSMEHAFLDIRSGIFPFSKVFVIALQPDAPPNRHVNEALRSADSSFEYFRMAERGMHLLGNITPEHHAIARTQAFYGMIAANGLTTIDDILNPP